MMGAPHSRWSKRRARGPWSWSNVSEQRETHHVGGERGAAPGAGLDVGAKVESNSETPHPRGHCHPLCPWTGEYILGPSLGALEYAFVGGCHFEVISNAWTSIPGEVAADTCQVSVWGK